jgi:hypothetical protein
MILTANEKVFRMSFIDIFLMLADTERLSPVISEVHEDKIPCEYCDELVKFDQYIIHTVNCYNKHFS